MSDQTDNTESVVVSAYALTTTRLTRRRRDLPYGTAFPAREFGPGEARRAAFDVGEAPLPAGSTTLLDGGVRHAKIDAAQLLARFVILPPCATEMASERVAMNALHEASVFALRRLA